MSSANIEHTWMKYPPTEYPELRDCVSVEALVKQLHLCYVPWLDLLTSRASRAGIKARDETDRYAYLTLAVMSSNHAGHPKKKY